MGSRAACFSDRARKRASSANGRSLTELNALCGGARVAAVIRSGQVRYDLDASSILNPGDTVVLIGSADSLAQALLVFAEDAEPATEAAPAGD